MNAYGLLPGHPSLVGQDMGGREGLLESQAAAQAGLLSGQPGSIFHSLMSGRGLDTLAGMPAFGGAGLLEFSPSNNNRLAALARYSSVGAGRTPDIPTSHHHDLTTSLQRMARGGGHQQFNRSHQQLDAMLFPQNFFAAAPTTRADQGMFNAERRRSLMAQRVTGIESLDAAIQPSSRLLGLVEEFQTPRGASNDTPLRTNMRYSTGGAGRFDLLQEASRKSPIIPKAKKEEIRRKRATKRKIRGGSEDDDDSDS
jgi:hypothetical protein